MPRHGGDARAGPAPHAPARARARTVPPGTLSLPDDPAARIGARTAAKATRPKPPPDWRQKSADAKATAPIHRFASSWSPSPAFPALSSAPRPGGPDKRLGYNPARRHRPGKFPVLDSAKRANARDRHGRTRD